MRIALVSPYSWSYQGGVNRHVEALAEEFLGRGHHVRVLAPFDPPGRLSRALHRAAPEPREMPDYLIPLGRTAGFRANGASPTSRPSRPAGSSLRAASCARATSTSSTSTSRWCRWSAGTRRWAATTPRRRHLPRLLDQGGPQPHRHGARRPARLQPPLGPDRRLRGGRLDRAALVRRPLRGHPQRGRRRRGAERAEADRARSCGSSSSAGRRSARACRSCSPPSAPWSSTCPAASP